MIKVNRIVYGAFETPDLEGQIDHYTKIMGLTLVAKEADAAYLSTSSDHHTVVLRKGAEAKCGAIGFQLAPGTDLGDYSRQIEAHGIKTERRSDPQPNIKEAVIFEDSKGTQIEVFVDPVR